MRSSLSDGTDTGQREGTARRAMAAAEFQESEIRGKGAVPTLVRAT